MASPGGVQDHGVSEDFEAPKQDLCVWNWRVFALRGAADQGQRLKKMVAAIAERKEGKEKERYLKIVEALEDPLQSEDTWPLGGAFWPWTGHATWSWL